MHLVLAATRVSRSISMGTTDASQSSRPVDNFLSGRCKHGDSNSCYFASLDKIPGPAPLYQLPKQAMANSRLGFLLPLLLAAILFVSPAIGSSDAPFMAAHKKVSLARLKTGVERVSISIDLYNEGSA